MHVYTTLHLLGFC